MKMFAMLFVAVLTFVTVGCEGDQGPAGPAGDDGNANVVSGTISPTNEEWLWNSSYWYQTTPGTATGYFTRYVDIAVPEVTAEIIATGVVLVAFEARPGSGLWTPLPFHFPSDDWTMIHTLVYEVSEGLIRLHYFNMPNQSGATPPNLSTWPLPTYTFKYTVIGGNVAEAMNAAGVDVTQPGQILDYLAAE